MNLPPPSVNEFRPDEIVEVSRDNTAHALSTDYIWRCTPPGSRIIPNPSLLGRMTWAQTKDNCYKPWPAWPCQMCVALGRNP